MSITLILATTDFVDLKIVSLALDIKSDKAKVEIVNSKTKTIVFDIAIWMWMTGGVWRFGWSIERKNDTRATAQLEDKLKVELQKILLPYLKES